MKQKQPSLRFIFKIHSKLLKRYKWNLNMSLEDAMAHHIDSVVSIGSSQMLRWIDELNGIDNIDGKIQEIQRRIKIERKKQKNKQSTMYLREFYDNLYNLQFVKDYVCVVMDSKGDYDRANNGFTINGIRFKRLLGTNGGVKDRTIVYVNELLYPELKKRIDNGRNKEQALVPAKLEAYQALVCSGSTPLPQPDGIIVVNDCITHFKDNVIMIDDSAEGEPKLSYVDDYEVEHNDSDGYGFMSPSYSRRVNEYLTGDGEHTISGMNTRYAWNKGMVYTFDFVDFADKVAGTYIIKDAWGDERDVREADVILTTSMLKLWDAYDSWEDYKRNCDENNYVFATPKITPAKLEGTRLLNYQFIQPYDLSDAELENLCKPTNDELSDVLGLDYRKSLVFLAGENLTVDSVSYMENNFVKALMVEPEMIHDPFVLSSINSMLQKRMMLAKKGSIRVNGNYAMISGDPYALAQSMFGLPVTGLLKAGEAYHKYWSDRGAKEIVCFRAPMTSMNNIIKVSLPITTDIQYWYQYMETVLIHNAWDTTCDAMNGADKDGDTNMCTDNPILLANTRDTRTIFCIQRKADKRLATEADIIAANKLAFNDDIGTITNYITSMFDVQAKFRPDSPEYEDLAYRIMCGQLYQQNSIDRCKGIISKFMPDYWFDVRAIRRSEMDDDDYQLGIAANRKPYFMIYVYPQLRRTYKTYVKSVAAKMKVIYGEDVPQRSADNPYIEQAEKYMPISDNGCTVNRMCHWYEEHLPTYKKFKSDNFDYSIMKSNVEYSRKDYEKISQLYADFLAQQDLYFRRQMNPSDGHDITYDPVLMLLEHFKAECEKVCTNEDELCDIILDICYTRENSKLFAWTVCGDKIIDNLLRRNGMRLSFPVQTSEKDSEFVYCGNHFRMQECVVDAI